MENGLKLFFRSKNNIWTDEFISEQMLKAHLDYSRDGASRNIYTVRKTIDWINSVSEDKKKLLDLGCGPGIYANGFDDLHYAVTGIDVSPKSIDYAQEWAHKENRKIKYVCQDYIYVPIHGQFDIAVCIYCDFGAMIPREQALFLKMSQQFWKRVGS